MDSGARIRDYILERKIGEGGMGEVWLARHALLGKLVAIKAMAEHLAEDTKFRERFLGEARAMAKLENPHIIGAMDFFEGGGRLLLVMPFVDGKSLGDMLDIAPRPLPPNEVFSLSRDILGALDYAHRRGVIHRDVKPSNILVDGEGRGYLTDFGIALMVGDQRRTRTGTMVGTPHYMSPEQISKPKFVDHRSDVYSFGCVLYEMVTGRPPFSGEHGEEPTDFTVMDGHINKSPIPPRRRNPNLPSALDEVVLKALAKVPEERYGGCGEFAKALEVSLVARGAVPHYLSNHNLTHQAAHATDPSRRPGTPEEYARIEFSRGTPRIRVVAGIMKQYGLPVGEAGLVAEREDRFGG